MLIDAFEPEGFTALAKDSIFMMPHLGSGIGPPARRPGSVRAGLPCPTGNLRGPGGGGAGIRYDGPRPGSASDTNCGHRGPTRPTGDLHHGRAADSAAAEGESREMTVHPHAASTAGRGLERASPARSRAGRSAGA